MIDLRHESVAELFGCGWTMARVAAALDLDADEITRLDRHADTLLARCSTVCSACGRRVRGRSHSTSLRAAFARGWDHTPTGHLRCERCLGAHQTRQTRQTRQTTTKGSRR